ncbi:MAG: DUF2235 domain-containing protein [Alphaproteobacteria bacterium]
MKRHVVCFDGTWQTLSQDKITNIGVIARSIAHHDRVPDAQGHPIEQIVIYTQGVGAVIHALPESSFLGSIEAEIERTSGGAFGEGVEDGIVQTYMRLAFNYEADDEIFIFGFSRGAFAARSLAGMISSVGIVSRRYVEQSWNAFRLYRARVDADWNDQQLADYRESCRKFRFEYGKGRRGPDGERVQTDEVPPIKYMGLFDTVVQRGFPELFGAIRMRRKYRFHNLDICDNVETARHALAIDEDRLGFPPTLWENLEEANKKRGKLAVEQRWFVGMHGDVGGGIGSKLSAVPLKWITDGAAAAGLRFYGTGDSPLKQTLEAAGINFDAPMGSVPLFWDGFSPMNYRWRPRRIWNRADIRPSETDIVVFDDNVAKRAWSRHVRPTYRPQSLRPFRNLLRDLAKKSLEEKDLRGKWF